jgi:hypothetical protein
VELVVGILIGVCLAMAVVVVLGFRALRARRSGPDLTQVTFDPDVMLRVRSLVAAGEKVQAVKLLREANPQLGLEQATLLVNRMATSAARRPVVRDAEPSSNEIPLEVELEARSLVSDGDRAGAVALISKSSGWDLRTARAYVDAL